MIFLHIHKHIWRATSAKHHDCTVYRCAVCGDTAFDAFEVKEPETS